ncbi:MAG: hypothetical protein HC897_02790 [Thermoanaerobaculia bacterium]|nr:hypothetical protein [Thermoanaerobaculia bacterium]
MEMHDNQWVFLFIFLLFPPQAAARQVAEKQTLAQVACPARGGGINYFVTQQHIEEEGWWRDRLVIFRVERTLDAFSESREVIWQNETNYSARTVPWPFWRASLVCDSNADGIFLILAYNRGISHFSLDLFFLSISLPEITADLPLSILKLPQAPKLRSAALINYSGRLPFDSDGLESIGSTLVGGR